MLLEQQERKRMRYIVVVATKIVSLRKTMSNMGNWEKQQKEKDEAREKDKTRREKLAGYFFDLSKICFTGMVISFILPLISESNNTIMWLVTVFGICLTISSAMLANKILK